MRNEKAQAFHHYMVKERYSGIMIKQRGLTYYVSRISNIRNSVGYEQYTSTLWSAYTTANLTDNPAISYRLYRASWKDWVAVKHQI